MYCTQILCLCVSFLYWWLSWNPLLSFPDGLFPTGFMFILLDNNLTLCLYFSDSVSPSVKLTYSVTCHFCPSETYSTCFSSVQSLSRVQFFVTPWTAARQATCPSSTPGVYSNSCPLSWWCHPTISSSVIPFSSCPQSFPASGSFQMSQLFIWGCQSIGVSASTSVLPMNTQGWSPLEWTGWTSLQSKGLSRVFSNTTVQKHRFFSAQPSL